MIRGSQLPEQIIIGVVAQDAYGGCIDKNPFNFKHFGIKEASIIVNGKGACSKFLKCGHMK